MRSALDHLIEKSEGITNGRMLYKILDFEMPTLGAMAVEFQKMPKLFSLIGRFDKCAVISDTAWIRTAAEIEGTVIPSGVFSIQQDFDLTIVLVSHDLGFVSGFVRTVIEFSSELT